MKKKTKSGTPPVGAIHAPIMGLAGCWAHGAIHAIRAPGLVGELAGCWAHGAIHASMELAGCNEEENEAWNSTRFGSWLMGQSMLRQYTYKRCQPAHKLNWCRMDSMEKITLLE